MFYSDSDEHSESIDSSSSPYKPSASEATDTDSSSEIFKNSKPKKEIKTADNQKESIIETSQSEIGNYRHTKNDSAEADEDPKRLREDEAPRRRCFNLTK